MGLLKLDQIDEYLISYALNLRISKRIGEIHILPYLNLKNPQKIQKQRRIRECGKISYHSIDFAPTCNCIEIWVDLAKCNSKTYEGNI